MQAFRSNGLTDDFWGTSGCWHNTPDYSRIAANTLELALRKKGAMSPLGADPPQMRTIERGGPMSAPYGIGWGRSLRLRNEPSLADAYEVPRRAKFSHAKGVRKRDLPIDAVKLKPKGFDL